MIEPRDITRQAVPLVDWNAIGSASKLQTTGDKLWVAKFVSGFTATVVQMTYRYQKKKSESETDFRRWTCDLCPVCKSERETQHHVMRCTSRRMTCFRRKEDTKISTWFDQNKIDPNIAEIIMIVLRDDGNTSFLQAARSLTTIERYHEIANAQDIIGYHNFILGRISKHWKIQQADF